MFEEKPWHHLLQLISQHRLLLSQVSLGIGLVLFSGGIVYLITLVNQRTTSSIVSSTSADRHTQASPATITVTITGAIKHPGVYKISINTLLVDLIQKAGGFGNHPDHFKIAQDLNLASSLTDGQHVFIPTISSSSLTSVSNPAATKNKISINTASLTELDALEGIGEKRAGDIVAGRPYQSIDDLITQKIITATLLEKIKTQITL